MAFKLIEIVAPEERVRAVTSIADELGASDVRVGPPLTDGRLPVTLVVGDIDRQALLDRLQAALGQSAN